MPTNFRANVVGEWVGHKFNLAGLSVKHDEISRLDFFARMVGERH
jgi:hypothetical protein